MDSLWPCHQERLPEERNPGWSHRGGSSEQTGREHSKARLQHREAKETTVSQPWPGYRMSYLRLEAKPERLVLPDISLTQWEL